ncbi:MAG TPA: SH3 domain-containing protein [Devosia sp.]|nr:SH3 domain-containing protein [Devosia sp.]
MRLATAAAVACTAAIVLLPGAASAATTAYATANVTVRERPSTSSDRVGSLSAGEAVTVQGCRQAWCYITSPERGFVSANYISTSRSSRVMISPNFNLSFNFPSGSFTIGNGGVSIGIGTGNDDNDFSQACFYSGSNYTGSRLCVDEGDSYRRLTGNWNDRISSIRNPDGLRVTVCQGPFYQDCRTYTTSARTLGSFNDEISSLRVR